jgi:tol-pal system protein YbgF
MGPFSLGGDMYKSILLIACLAITNIVPLTLSAQTISDDELRQLKIKVQTLEHAVYKNNTHTSAPVQTNVAPLLSRIDALEETIARLTGRVEELEHLRNSTKITPKNSSQPADNSAVNDQYQSALSLVYGKKHAKAEDALKRFIGAHPKHELIGNAYYWLGESHYARQQYEEASLTFLKAYELFPNGNKTHDNLLKLGMALSQLGKNNEACITFGKLLDSMPSISISIKARAREEFSSLNCK